MSSRWFALPRCQYPEKDRDCGALIAACMTVVVRRRSSTLRLIETASPIQVAFASACPEADTFRTLALALKPTPTWPAPE